MLIVIVGCGRMGSRMANKLSSQGKSVIVIDNDELKFDSLTSDYSGFNITGDATQMAVLNQAKIEKADVVLTLTGDDNINMAVAHVAKNYFKVAETIARVHDPSREPVFSKLGIKTICPTRLSVDSLLDQIEDIENEA